MLKRFIIWALRATAIIVIITGVFKIFEYPNKTYTDGIYMIIGGVIGVLVMSRLRTKVEHAEYKKKQQTNRCANCGGSMHGAFYRTYWSPEAFKDFDDPGLHDFNSKAPAYYSRSADFLPVTVTAICPSCGLEKAIKFEVPCPSSVEVWKPSYSKEAYVQRKIREYVEYLFKD